MRRLCLFTGGFAIAAVLYLLLLHGAPGALLAALAVICALLLSASAADCAPHRGLRAGSSGRICLVPGVRGAFSAPICVAFRRNGGIFRAGAGCSANEQLRAVRLRPADAGRKKLYGSHLL